MEPTRILIPTPRGEVLVRASEAADVMAFSRLRVEALRNNPTSFGSSCEAGESCSPEWALGVINSDPRDERSFVAEQAGDLLGMASVRRSRKVKLRHAASVGGVYIQPEWRGMGIIDGLLEACAAWAREQQVSILKLAVVTTNLAGLKAYQRLGYSIYGTEPGVILHEGVYYDEYLMAREIERTGLDDR